MKSILVKYNDGSEKVIHIAKIKMRNRKALSYALKGVGKKLGTRQWYVTYGSNWYMVYYYQNPQIEKHVAEICLFLEFMEEVKIPVQNYLMDKRSFERCLND